MRRLPQFAIVLAILALSGGAPRAQQDVPLDFVSGDGWFTKQASSTPPIGKASFGADGGVKNGQWTGDLVYVDKDLGLNVSHLTITGYLRVGADGTDAKGRTTGTRDICGTASTNRFGNVHFRVRLTDNGYPDRRDTFRIGLAATDGTVVYTAQGSLGDPAPGAGKIRIVNGNRSSIAPATPPDCRVSFGSEPPPPPPPPPTATRIEETNPAVTYTGSWIPQSRSDLSGGTVVESLEAGATATLSFNGTGASWIGFKATWGGIAEVFLDGALKATVDTYAPSEQAQAVLYTAGGLAAGPHTLMVRVTGTWGPSGNSAWIVVDAFDVVTSGGTQPPPGPARFEEGSAALAPAASWSGVTSASTGVTLSGGSAAIASTAGATATFTFTGTGVAWIGFKCERCGIARVSLDGAVVATVDTYAPSRPAASGALFSRTGLASGGHTLVIEVTGTMNPSSLDPYIVVDAFDVS